MGARIGQDPGDLSKLDTPHWERGLGGLREMEQRLQEAEQQAPGPYRAAVTYRNAREWTKSGLEAWTGIAQSEPFVIELT